LLQRALAHRVLLHVQLEPRKRAHWVCGVRVPAQQVDA
jgi:hypothetical protein